MGRPHAEPVGEVPAVCRDEEEADLERIELVVLVRVCAPMKPWNGPLPPWFSWMYHCTGGEPKTASEKPPCLGLENLSDLMGT
jgi:hypothetical protein